MGWHGGGRPLSSKVVHTRSVQPSAIAALTLIGALSLSGCGDHVVVSPTGDIDTALSRWREAEASSYSFVLDSTCGDGRLRGLYQVTVDDDAVSDLEPINAVAEDSGARAASAPTIDDVFTEIASIRLNDVDTLEANYHIKSGYPTYFAVDPDESTPDDETCYTISSVSLPD